MRRRPRNTAPQAVTAPPDVPAAAQPVPAAPRPPLAVVSDDAGAEGSPGSPAAMSTLPAPSAPSGPRLPGRLIMPLLVLVGSLVGALATAQLALDARATTGRAAGLAASVTLEAQRLGTAAEAAARGSRRALQTVSEARGAIADALATLDELGNFASTRVAAAQVLRQAVDEQADELMQRSEVLVGFGRRRARIEALAPELLAHADRVVETALRQGVGAEQVELSGRLRTLSERIDKHTRALARDPGAAAPLAVSLSRDTDALGAAVAKLRAEVTPAVQARLESFARASSELGRLVGEILGDLAGLAAGQRAARGLAQGGKRLAESVQGLPDTRGAWHTSLRALPWVLGVAGALSLLLVVRAARAEARDRDAERRSRDQQTQAAIGVLTETLQSLADGDLSVAATLAYEVTTPAARATNALIVDLRQRLDALSRLAGQVTATAAELRTALQGIVSGTQGQLAALEQTAHRVGVLGDACAALRDDARGVEVAADHAAEQAGSGIAAARDAVAEIDAVCEHFRQSSIRIRQLAQSTEDLHGRLEGVAELSERMRTLALSAAPREQTGGDRQAEGVIAGELQSLSHRALDIGAGFAERVGGLRAEVAGAADVLQQARRDSVALAARSTFGEARLGDLQDAAGGLARRAATLSDSSHSEAQQALGIVHRLGDIGATLRQGVEAASDTVASLDRLASLCDELAGRTRHTLPAHREL